MKRKFFIIIFDVPLGKRTLARKIQRKLNKINAEVMQQSVWKSKDLSGLLEIASVIKQEGGQATILKEDVVGSY